MAIRPIRLFGDPVLRTAADPVDTVDSGVQKLVADMLETMDFAAGVGLAAPQVGISQRIFVYDDRAGNRGALINPVWEAVGEETEVGGEGCLSVPEIGGDVERHRAVRVRGLDADGAAVELTWEGLMARVVQHETDHLDGVMFMQRMDADSRRTAMKEIRAAEWFGKAAIVGDTAFDDLAVAQQTARAAQPAQP